MNSKILVTGANGQLGNELRRLCRNFPGLEFIFTDVDMLDITNPDAVSVFMEASKPAILVNCAAFTDVDGAEIDVKNARKINALAPQVLAAACAMQNAFLIHISTDYVFDGEKGEAYTEEDQTNPLSVYGSSKLEGEEKIKTVFDDFV
ncbi:MAG: sugar nucleotide-binding protein, partial [Prolixibacteraceae bacterium]|nr:sugar nucleotide-binding protein [Prolixibacteraceae bacterium]